MRINLKMLRLAIHYHPICEGSDEFIITKSVSCCSWLARWDRDAVLMSNKLIKIRARVIGLTWRDKKENKKLKKGERGCQAERGENIMDLGRERGSD